MKKGFTLIELAIVLVIIGILLGIGTGMIGILVKSAHYRKTKEIVNAACEAVVGYAIKNKRLPQSLSELGIRTIDDFGRKLKYFTAYHSTSGDICVENATPIQITDRRTNSTISAYFIVYSTSENLHDETYRDNSTFIIEQPGIPVDNYTYDDIVCYRDINFLISKACSTLQITTNTLPTGTQCERYPDTTIAVSNKISTCSVKIIGNSTLTLADIGMAYTCTENGIMLYGTPKKAGAFSIEVEAANAVQHAKKMLTLVIQPNPVRITTPYIPPVCANSTATYTLTAIGGDGNYNWSCSPDPCPDGHLQYGNRNSSYTEIVRVNASCGGSNTRTYSINVISCNNEGNSGGGNGGNSGGNNCYRIEIINEGENRFYETGRYFITCIYYPLCGKFKHLNGIFINMHACIGIFKKRNKRICLIKERTITYNEALSADRNGNCKIKYRNGYLYDD